MAKIVARSKAYVDPKSFTKKLKDKVKRDLFLSNRMKNIQAEVRKRIDSRINEFIDRSPVTRALLSENEPSDLQAHLGFNQDDAETFVNDVKEAVKNSIEVVPSQIRTEHGNKIASFTIKSDDLAVNLYSIKYTRPSQAWLLEAPLITVDTHGIVFFKNEEQKRKFEEAGGYSHSGRAYMSSNKHVADHFPWVLPPIAHPKTTRSDNYIEDIINSAEFRAIVKDSVEAAILRIVFRRQRT